MTTKRFQAVAVAACMAAGLPALLINCGGSNSSPAGTTTPVVVAPTVTISGTTNTTITAPETLTFTFSSDVGSSFTASDVTVTNGSISALTKVSATVYTALLTPTASSTGTIQITVPVGAFTDATSGTANTVAATTTQAFNTNPVVAAPTVVIGGTVNTAITAPETITFTFSQDPGTSFTASDVTLTPGTMGALVKGVDATHYSMVITPPASGTGTMQIGIAAGMFTNAEGTANTAAASASQAYGSAVVQSNYDVIDFNSTLGAGLAYLATGFNGSQGAVITSATIPSGAPAGGPSYLMIPVPVGTTITSGVTVSEGSSMSIGAVPFFATGATTPTATTLTMVINAPAAGIPIELKIENAVNGTQYAETHATTTAAGWQTLTFDFTNNTQAGGLPTPALNSTYTYDKMSVFPDFLQSPTTEATYYIGAITFVGATAPLAPPLPPVVATVPTTLAAAPTLPAASVISLFNSSNTYTNIAVGAWNPSWGQAGALTDISVAGTTIKDMYLNIYQGINISSPNGAPTDTGVQNITGKATFHISYWTSTGTNLKFIPIDALDHEVPIDGGVLVQNAWTDLEFPITDASVDLTTIRQLKFTTTSAETIYLDNIYFH
jgi:methionine-rich copper-binding protein CopC